MIRSIATAAIVSAFALSAAFGASAQNVERPEITVNARNVDFSDARQAKAFYAKLNSAAAEVCDSRTTGSLITHYRAERDCERQAVHDAVRQINAPELSRLDGQVDERGSTARSMTMVDRGE